MGKDEIKRGSRKNKEMGFGASPAILVIDMTYAYFDPSSHLGYGAAAGWKSVAKLQKLLPVARIAGIPIIYTRSAPLKRIKNELKGLGRKHVDTDTLANPKMSTVVEELTPEEGDLVIDKYRASAFFGTPLVSYLIFHRIDTLILTGTSTSGCVRTSAADASSHNYHVIIPEECVFDREPLWHDVTLAVLGQKYADVRSTFDVCAYLRKLKQTRRAGVTGFGKEAKKRKLLRAGGMNG
ncbi:MAG: isochorismatase family protein [Deltaproteobacteria bacterium]|nr:isochorismatase family protein [Deltaproteobacteria bacterium]